MRLAITYHNEWRNHMRVRFTPAALTSLALSSLASASNWQIDPAHSAAQFSVRHMMVSNVRGEFGKMSGWVNLDDKDISRSTAEATIDTTTINTREPKRDTHLKSPDFFDVEKYPTMTFKSTSFKKVAPEKYKVAGDLTLHGVTKPIVLDVAAPDAVSKLQGQERRGASATTTLNRKDFGLIWNKPVETGGVMVGDEVVITLDLELVKKPGAAQ